MKKVMILICLVALSIISGCSTLPPSGTKITGNDPVVNDFGYLICNYVYKEKPFGMRSFNVVVKPEKEKEFSNLSVNLSEKENDQIVIFKMVPGNYKVDRVEYNNYTYKTVSQGFTVEPGQMYYIDKVQVMKVEQTTMVATNYIPSIVDAIAAARNTWDFIFINDLVNAQNLLNTNYPNLNSLKISRIME